MLFLTNRKNKNNELPDTDVRGAWLGGCNEAKFFEYAKSDLKVSRSAIRELKVFISTGKTDNLVNATYRKAVEDGCEDAGVKEVRSELYDGGHSINAEQFMQALDWFLMSE